MTLEVSSEFIDEQKTIMQNLKKGGPYSESDRGARRAEVYRLHFELGYTAASIAKVMNVNEKTIYDDIKFLNKKLASELRRADFDSLLMTQLKRFDTQRTRLLQKLDKSPDDNTLEKMIFDIDCRMAAFVSKIFEDDDRIHKKAVECLNKREAENATGGVWSIKTGIYKTSRETQRKINSLLASDSETENFD